MVKSSAAAKIISSLVVILLVVAPFHAFLTVGAASLIGHYTLLRLWPEVVLLAATACGLAIVWQRPQLRRQLLHDKLYWLMAGYAVITVLLGLLAYGRHTVSLAALTQGIVIDLRLPLAFVVAAIAVAVAPKLGQRWARYLLIPAVLVVVFGLLQLVLPSNFLTHFGYGPHTIPAIETVDQKADYQRLQSTLRGANPLGAYLVIVIAALVGLFAKGRRRLLSTGLGVAAAAVLFFTYSRSAYFGTLLAVMLVLWWMLNRPGRKVLLIGLAVAVLVGTAAFVALRHTSQFENTFFHTSQQSHSTRSSNQDRASALQMGWHDVTHQPFGKGPGSAGPASAHNHYGTRIAENYYLQIGQETGWLGLAFFLGINGVVAYRLWQQRRSVFAVVLLASFVGLVVVNMLSHAWADETLSLVWWTLAGIALGGSAILQPITKKKHVQKISQPA